MTLFTPGPPVLAGVDEVLRVLTTEALKGLATPLGVTVGPLDRPIVGPRLNWFLYRVEPAPAFVNMEPPQRGWQTRRGHPPLALTLHYLLTCEPGELTETGSEDDIAHAGLSALMSALHENGIFGHDSPLATGPDRTLSQVAPALDGLIEPLRISLEQVPFETITALWNSGSHALRLSLAYQVSLVTVPAQVPFAAAQQVLTRRIAVAPALFPVLTSISPATLSFDQPMVIEASGLLDLHQVTLGRLPRDPDDPTDGRPDPAHTHSTGPWVMAETLVAGARTVHLPNGALVPGPRPLVVTNLADGLPAGSGSYPVTLVPIVVSAPLLHAGDLVTLDVCHVADDGQAFFGPVSVPYTRVTDATVQLVVPALPAAPTVPVSLRSGPYGGPPVELAVAP